MIWIVSSIFFVALLWITTLINRRLDVIEAYLEYIQHQLGEEDEH